MREAINRAWFQWWTLSKRNTPLPHILYPTPKYIFFSPTGMRVPRQEVSFSWEELTQPILLVASPMFLWATRHTGSSGWTSTFKSERKPQKETMEDLGWKLVWWRKMCKSWHGGCSPVRKWKEGGRLSPEWGLFVTPLSPLSNLFVMWCVSLGKGYFQVPPWGNF